MKYLPKGRIISQIGIRGLTREKVNAVNKYKNYLVGIPIGWSTGGSLRVANLVTQAKYDPSFTVARQLVFLQNVRYRNYYSGMEM